ncbi:heme-binding HmuY-like protein [Dysgonomonas alginatilytica]|uniref:Heme-binding HmuY-like protein n=1 Tax=Dysgonomonas alginatilytica TaxID=1605892 RepID=A0A2V3PPC9_9BACT|nr:HmuY family protein [Dysgonomonas alginatilytica]PXV63199.1 heme-binding HmuY-like protein [Dysgonomonas alginatilytica]
MKRILYFSFLLVGLLATSCSDDDAPLPDNSVNFSASELGIGETEASKSFTINIDRKADAALTIALTATPKGISYGTDYTTTPVATDNKLTVTIPAGETSATVEVKKVAALFDGDETIDFEITTANGGIVLGDKKTLKLTFSTIVSTGSSLTLNGGEGGSKAVNSVFVDFSGNEQTSVARKSWNFGFSTGSDFGVILNNTTASTAIEATNQSLDVKISAADSAAYVSKLVIGGDSGGGFTIVDDVLGDLSKSVIKEGKVYIVSLGDAQPPLYKIKVSQKDANTYTIQYAKSNEATVKSLDVAKNTAYNFVYASITENKVVPVAPEKAKWDIEWTSTMYKTGTTPYIFADFVYINGKEGVTAVEVLGDKEAYNAFNSTGLSSLQFSADIDVIGSKWRAGGGPSSSPVVKADRFYVVKDAAGNVYKLQFVSLGDQRGYPQIKYVLVK